MLKRDQNKERSMMTDARFWSDDTTVLLSENEIQQVNSENPPASEYFDEEGTLHTVRWSDIDDTISAEDVIGLARSHEQYRIDKLCGSTGKMFGEEGKQTFYENRNLSALGEKSIVKYAICIKRTVSLSFPADEPFYDCPNDYFYNLNASAELTPGDGAIVLHTSKDGEWLFVLADFFSGWIRKDTVAFCADRKEWESVLNPERFLVVTGHKVVIDTVNSARGKFDEIACMGTKLRLSEQKTGTVNGRSANGAYIVKMPAGNDDGSLTFIDATVAVSQEVNVGYLPLTSSNILKQAFKFLGHSYGWGGMDGANDCSGMIRQIYHCFGLNLARNSQDIKKEKGLRFLDFQEISSRSERIFAFENAVPGSMIFIRGNHVMLYLGTKDGAPYCISACGFFADRHQKIKLKIEYTAMNCVFICNMTDVFMDNRKSWLENTNKVIMPIR